MNHLITSLFKSISIPINIVFRNFSLHKGCKTFDEFLIKRKSIIIQIKQYSLSYHLKIYMYIVFVILINV